MTSQVMATYAHGVFRPDQPVNLPENSKVQLILQPLVSAPEVGSPQARAAYAQHCRESNFDSGAPRPARDELYDRL